MSYSLRVRCLNDPTDSEEMFARNGAFELIDYDVPRTECILTVSTRLNHLLRSADGRSHISTVLLAGRSAIADAVDFFFDDDTDDDESTRWGVLNSACFSRSH